MSNETTTDAVETTAVAVRDTTPQEVVVPPKAQVTASQGKIDAIADLTHSAYQKAGTLNLTKEESEQLQADFPDEAFKPGAAGKESLLYIEHAFLRERFIKVCGMGGWALIPRSRWAEPFVTQKGVEGSRVYVEAMLVVRGAFVAESIGEMEYYPKNASQNYGDAVEGATTAAFRRCAKNFGVGLQAWKRDWCDSWWQRKREKDRGGRTAQPTVTPTPRAAAPAAKPEPPKMPTAVSRDFMIKELHLDDPGSRKMATEYFQKINQLLPTETIEDLPFRFVPASRKQIEALLNCLQNFASGGDAVSAFEPHEEVDAPRGTKKPVEVPREKVDKVEPDGDEAWRSFPVPYGKHAGVLMGDLEKNTLWGFWKNHAVETEYKGKPIHPDKIAKSQEFRDHLDACGEHYEFEDND